MGRVEDGQRNYNVDQFSDLVKMIDSSEEVYYCRNTGALAFAWNHHHYYYYLFATKKKQG